MNTLYDENNFTYGNKINKLFLSRIFFSFIPIIIGGIYVIPNLDWYKNDVVKSKYSLGIIPNIIIYILIAIILAWVWYKLLIMFPGKSTAIDILFSSFMALQTFYWFSFFGQHDIESGRIMAMLMTIVMIILSIQIYRINKLISIPLIIIALFLLYQTRILYSTYPQ